MAKRLDTRHPEVLVLPNGCSTVILRDPEKRAYYVYCRIFVPRHLNEALKLQQSIKRYGRFTPKHWTRLTSQKQFYDRFDRAIGN